MPIMDNFVIFSLIFLLIIERNLASYSAEDCTKLGFTKANLICSTCEHFNETNELVEIYESCKECCTKEKEENQKRYAKAVLEVCTCKFGAYPQIEAFIKGPFPNKYKNLEIRYVRGLDPFIRFYDKNGVKIEDVDIHKWDTDTVDEFLDTFLDKETSTEKDEL